MALHLRVAGWKTFHPARLVRRRPWAAILLSAGATAFLGGAAVLAVSLAPMWGIGAETATVTAVEAAPVPVIGSTGGLSISDSIRGSVNQVITAPPVIDRPVNGIAFQMRIPAIGYSSSVVEGVDAAHLEKGPGHYPTSPWPGRPGNVAIAAHNVYWLSFSRLKAGDRVEIQTPHGLYLYEITGSKVVEPDDRTVLQSTAEHQLTLTTCYPLWAGAYATQRLIFFAREIGGVG
ncbi:MAG TPA: class D sortase [Candidatus Dormibacteraeota bacterium]|nr:class D sortase [Candidatus Dormibacteraeota bacterium]